MSNSSVLLSREPPALRIASNTFAAGTSSPTTKARSSTTGGKLLIGFIACNCQLGLTSDLICISAAKTGALTGISNLSNTSGSSSPIMPSDSPFNLISAHVLVYVGLSHRNILDILIAEAQPLQHRLNDALQIEEIEILRTRRVWIQTDRTTRPRQ